MLTFVVYVNNHTVNGNWLEFIKKIIWFIILYLEPMYYPLKTLFIMLQSWNH